MAPSPSAISRARKVQAARPIASNQQVGRLAVIPVSLSLAMHYLFRPVVSGRRFTVDVVQRQLEKKD